MNRRIIPLLNILLLLLLPLSLNSPLVKASEDVTAVDVIESDSELVITEQIVEQSELPESVTVTTDVLESLDEDRAAIVSDAVSSGAAGAGLNDLLQVIASFVLVIGLLMFMLWAIKRWQPRLAPGRSGMSVKSVLSLGGRDRLVLVQAGDRQILLGVSPGNITLLGDYDELLPPPPAPEEQEPSTTAVDTFRKLLVR